MFISLGSYMPFKLFQSIQSVVGLGVFGLTYFFISIGVESLFSNFFFLHCSEPSNVMTIISEKNHNQCLEISNLHLYFCFNLWMLWGVKFLLMDVLRTAIDWWLRTYKKPCLSLLRMAMVEMSSFLHYKHGGAFMGCVAETLLVVVFLWPWQCYSCASILFHWL